MKTILQATPSIQIEPPSIECIILHAGQFSFATIFERLLACSYSVRVVQTVFCQLTCEPEAIPPFLIGCRDLHHHRHEARVERKKPLGPWVCWTIFDAGTLHLLDLLRPIARCSISIAQWSTAVLLTDSVDVKTPRVMAKSSGHRVICCPMVRH